MRAFALGLCLLAAPAAADTLSEATGNWAGASNQGFYFRAALSFEGEAAQLKIWNDLGGIPAANSGVQFDNGKIMLMAYATDGFPRLEVLDTGSGSILQVVNEFADEEYAGRSVVQIQYIDNQFTVIGYYHRDLRYFDQKPYECEVDLRNGKVTVNGVTSDLPPMDFEAQNASEWTYSAAFDRGYCPQDD
ncbi:hypothetical protein [Tabrizicola sp.]|uniref:hypothetical protein n=1 Tax=Tabrizicola sp. TaxID=2005166 RepID=UPI00286BA157|nr:hypothetical protein [Tabrizicola sp.]